MPKVKVAIKGVSVTLTPLLFVAENLTGKLGILKSYIACSDENALPVNVFSDGKVFSMNSGRQLGCVEPADFKALREGVETTMQ